MQLENHRAVIDCYGKGLRDSDKFFKYRNCSHDRNMGVTGGGEYVELKKGKKSCNCLLLGNT